ncbi:hypothetical protein F4802DRAFT_611758 [Xylaria palmicola]|nr:hypothetical protein F4802DRAFT_611758 [Xylaria palmicola]
MTEQEKTILTRTNVLEVRDGPIAIGERWPRKNRYRGPPDLPGNFRIADKLQIGLNSLQFLQSKRDQYLLRHSLGVPLQFIHDSLPFMVMCDVDIIPPNERGIFTNFTKERLGSPEVAQFVEHQSRALGERTYHFWPVDIGQVGEAGEGEEAPPNWALIVLHLRRSSKKAKDKSDEGPYDTLSSFGVISPDHGQASRDLEDDIADVLPDLLAKMGIERHSGTKRERPWVPPRYVVEHSLNAPQLTKLMRGANEDWSSGLRVFEMVRVWLDRLAEQYCITPHEHDHERFWASHPGWFNPDAVRSNMIGMAATIVNRSMNSTTRIAIEPFLDNSMQYNGEGILTETMMPRRRHVGAFTPNKSRRHPFFIDDHPPALMFHEPVLPEKGYIKLDKKKGNGDDDDDDADDVNGEDAEDDEPVEDDSDNLDVERPGDKPGVENGLEVDAEDEDFVQDASGNDDEEDSSVVDGDKDSSDDTAVNGKVKEAGVEENNKGVVKNKGARDAEEVATDSDEGLEGSEEGTKDVSVEVDVEASAKKGERQER